MSLGGIFDVSISLIFMYLLLSLICTTLNEAFATWFLNLRSRTLRTAVENILEDQALVARFYKHGLIKGGNAASRPNSKLEDGPGSPDRHSSYIHSKNFAMALLGSVNPDQPIPLVKDIEGSLDTLPDGVKDILKSALAIANGDIVKLRDEIADWFDSAMDRLGGHYKRWLRLISFGTGLSVAIVLNADSVAVGKAVWMDEALRQQFVASAGNFLNQNPVSCPVPSVDQKNVGAPATAEPGAQTPASATSTTNLQCHLEELVKQVESLRPLPIGWTADNLTEANTFSWWGLKTIGLLWTALAISVGAPFWFDVLAKFMNIRGSGKKPSRAKGEKVS